LLRVGLLITELPPPIAPSVKPRDNERKVFLGNIKQPLQGVERTATTMYGARERRGRVEADQSKQMI
jgi:hypothetical protein